MKKTVVLIVGFFSLFGCLFLLKPVQVQAGNKAYCKLYGYAFYQPSNRGNRNKSAKRQLADKVIVSNVRTGDVWKSGTNFRGKWEARNVNVPSDGEITYTITAYKGREQSTTYVSVNSKDGGRTFGCPEITIVE